MKTRKFKGSAVQSVMDEIRQSVGEDALIVSMTEGNDGVEIEVGLDSQVTLEKLGEEREFTEPITLKEEIPTTCFRESLERILLRQGVKYKHARKIIEHVPEVPEVGRGADYYIGHGLDSVLDWHSLLPFESKAVALIGATGVGKTTTIAKLAARLKMAFEINVGLISADDYRVGAGFHLETYATLLRLPYRSIQNAEDKAQALKQAIEDLNDCDLILIDTAGCGPREKGRIADLSQIFKAAQDIEKLLVLPAPSNDFDLHGAASAFDQIGFDRIVLTKLDESGFLGPVLNTVLDLNRPLSFITNGQRVPEDIEPASGRRLGWMLTRLMH